MIYVNMKVAVIDFQVTQSKVYSFFIEDEFCEIHLERKGDKMFYTFEINKTIDTPRNRIRKKTQNKYLKQTALFFGAMLAIAVLIGIGLDRFKRKQEQKLYTAQTTLPVITAQIKEIEPTAASMTIHYSFVSNGKEHDFAVDISAFNSQPFLPLEAGDEFQLQYNPRSPYQHELFLNQPTAKQLNQYLVRAAEKHLTLHPEYSPEGTICELKTVFEEAGPIVFSIYFHQDEEAEGNPDFNSDTYSQLVQNPDIKRLIQENCY